MSTSNSELTLIGALWKTRSEKGRTYLSGNLDIGDVRYKVLVFANNVEPESNKPNYRVMLREAVPVPGKEHAVGPLPGADDDFDF